jgi:hypothetical protein
MAERSTERGSALTEAAIIFPCLVLILYWSAALTDVMVLKLKAAEALRYTLWESTVFKPPSQIDSEVQQRFVDLRSPKAINVQYTSLLMYPLARDMAWRGFIDTTSTRVGLGGTARLPPGNTIWDRLVNALIGALSRTVDAAVAREQFNVNGEAIARVTLVHARHDEQASRILKGGDLLGLKGGNDLDHPPSMTNLTFQAPLPSQRPMHLVFDTWKAWPRPAAYTRDGGSTDVTVSPARTYPVVEQKVSAQVKAIAFFGLTRYSWFNKLNGIVNRILTAGVSQTLIGGTLPDVFSSARMDESSRTRGPITILPVAPRDVSYAPDTCDFQGRNQPCPTTRIGDFTSTAQSPRFMDNFSTMGDGVDRTRYTVPYRINSTYWRQSGGTDTLGQASRLDRVNTQLATQNDYVNSYACRGHFFAGSIRAQETVRTRRYRGCDR